MDTFYAKNFGATDLTGVLKQLGSNHHACTRLLESLGPIRAVEEDKDGMQYVMGTHDYVTGGDSELY